MSAPIENIVFDFGGVLLDWNPRYLYRKIIHDEQKMEFFLKEICNASWNEKLDAGRSFHEAVTELSQLHPEYKEWILAYHHRWDEMLVGEISETVELLKNLAEKKIPLYALTNWSDEKFDKNRHRFDFLKIFKGIVISGVEKVVKPHREIYEILLNRYQLQASSTLFIDDIQKNIDGAHSVGIQGVLFQSPAQLRLFLRTKNLI